MARPSATQLRRRRLARTLLVLLFVIATGIAVNVGGRALLAKVKPPGCAVAGLDGGWFGFDPERLDSAATISSLAVKRELPGRAAVIAVATAMQESKLRNLQHGDRDSLGLFQQRPSQGWGTPAQILDPVHATNAFYDHLIELPGYTTRPLTVVAQEVQRSGYPDAYARHEAEATVLAQAFTEGKPEAVACRLDPPASPRPAAAVLDRMTRELGVEPVPAEGSLEVRTDSAGKAWTVADWSVARAYRLGIISVTVGDRTWTRSMDESALAWHPAADEGADPNVVVIRM